VIGRRIVGEALAGKHAVVTGGSRGIGRAVAAALLAEGATVTIMGRDADRLHAAAAELGARVVVIDVTDAASVERAFAEAGSVDILINNAGHAESAPFKRTDPALWARMIEVNLTGTYLCTRAVVAGMVERDWGRVVNVASTAGLTGYPYVSAYTAAKHGVIGLTRALALELARSGVTVNAVCPGYTETNMLAESVANIMQKTGRSEAEARAQLSAGNPQGRFVQPEEVAHSVLWLCLPGSDAMTGQAIAVAGGEIL
jgi:NAD(P)-dependent dehydrogenase (short-subunit alcohol dehydrogenase family)